MESNPLTSFCVLFDGAMLRNIRKCTVAEAHRISDKVNWDVTLDEMEKFIGMNIMRRISGQRDLSVKSIWKSTWVFPMFKKTIKTQIQGNNVLLTCQREE